MKQSNPIRVKTLQITSWGDYIIEIKEFTETGTSLGKIDISLEELPLLIKVLQEIQAKRQE